MGALTAEQLAERRNFCGASEVAAALGLSRHTSRLQLYLRKTTDEPPAESAPMRFGTLLESHVLDEFQNLIAPRVIERPNNMDRLFFGTTNAPLACHLDGALAGSTARFEAVVEAKTARDRNGWGEPGTDAVPQDYLLQVQAQMYLTGCRLAYVPVLFRDSLDLEVYESTYDAELAAMIVEGVREFWSHVERREPPAPDFESPATLGVIRKVFPGTSGAIMQATPEQELYYRTLCDAQERVSSYEHLADSAKAHLLWELGDGAELRFSDGRALRRKKVLKKAYSVEASEYIDCRLIRVKE